MYVWGRKSSKPDYSVAGFIALRWGGVLNVNFDGFFGVHGTLNVNTGTVNVNTAGSLTILAGGTINLNSGSILNVKSAGTLIVNSGGTFDVSGTLNVYGDLNLKTGGTLSNTGTINQQCGGIVVIEPGSTFTGNPYRS